MSNNAQDLSKTYSTFVENHRDEFILDYLNTNNTNVQENNVIVGDSKSFSFFDREANKTYLISAKDNTPKDKLVMSSGVAPDSSDIFDYYVNTIKQLSLLNNNHVDKGFDKLVYDFSKLLIKLEKPIGNIEVNNSENLKKDTNIKINDLQYLETEYDTNLPMAKIDVFTSIAKELIIQYEDANFVTKGYDNNLISKLFSYLSRPTITIDEFRKLSINFNYMEGVYAGSSINTLRFSGLFQQNYQAVVSEKFIKQSDKKILPLTNNKNPIHS
ncbi:MAG: hypothetical protein RSB95_04865 [Bacilli bacterium]